MGQNREDDNDLRSKESSQEVANDTTNSMFGEDIKTVVDAEPELDLGRQVADNAANHTEDDRGPGRDETRGGGDGDKTSNRATAEADGAPLPLEAVVH